MVPDREKLRDKCLAIYRRKGSFRTVFRFLERIFSEPGTAVDFFESTVRPAVRREFFPDLSLSSFQSAALEIYRTGRSRTEALTDIWEKIDWVVPFSSEEHYEIVELLEKALAMEANPPTQEDWDFLNDWIMK